MNPVSLVRRRRLWQGAALGTASLALIVGTATAADHAVTVGDNNYTPKEITIAAGDTVNWTYQGSVSHDVVLENGEFDSDDFATDGTPDTVSFTFEEAGTYNYYCTYHANCEDGQCFGEMWGTVTVEAAAEPTDEPTTEAPTQDPEPTDEPTTEAPTPEPTEDATPAEASTEAASPTSANDMPNTGNGTPMVVAVALLTAGFLGLRRRGLVG